HRTRPRGQELRRRRREGDRLQHRREAHGRGIALPFRGGTADTRHVSTTGEWVVAKNQAVFREVNERIRELGERLRSDAPTDLVSFVCECSASECHETVELTLAEYERVRSAPAQFVAAVDHLWRPQLEG